MLMQTAEAEPETAEIDPVVLEEYNALEDKIEASSMEATWELADKLVKWAPKEEGGRGKLGSMLPCLAAQGRRSEDQLRKLRLAAEKTKGARMDGVTTRDYLIVLRAFDGDLKLANAWIREKGVSGREFMKNLPKKEGKKKGRPREPELEFYELVDSELAKALESVGKISARAEYDKLTEFQMTHLRPLLTRFRTAFDAMEQKLEYGSTEEEDL